MCNTYKSQVSPVSNVTVSRTCLLPVVKNIFNSKITNIIGTELCRSKCYSHFDQNSKKEAKFGCDGISRSSYSVVLYQIYSHLKSLENSAYISGFIAELQYPSQNSTEKTIGDTHSPQNALTTYTLKNGSQQNTKPPTMMPRVFAAFVSIRKRFT